MELKPGAELGPYEILEPIGAGGMGEVYKARDTRLDRIVAIKVSHEEFSQRFGQEARAVAALNHSNICTLFDVGPNYLVMEYLEGDTLAARIAKGPLPFDQALSLGMQIADALDAAHRKGIVHRDLKPANVMLTRSGAKLLDFGLARMRYGGPSPGENVTQAMTTPGTILGTFQYMAPEQLEGKECDARSDIFSLGLVLYEMAAGKRAFIGESRAALIAEVMRCDPKLDGLFPPQFAHVVTRCLTRNPENRWQTARDVKLELEWGGQSSPSAPSAVVRKAPLRFIWRGLAILAYLMAALISFVHFREAAPVAEPVRLQITLPENMSYTPSGAFAVSPDGRLVVFAAAGPDTVARLWVRNLNSVEVRPLLGTEGNPSPLAPPFWSPDSRFIAFDAGGKLKTIAVTGGPAKVLSDLPLNRFAGGSWNRDGVIIFGTTMGVMRVSPAGGDTSSVTVLDPSRKEFVHISPSFLPDGRHFLYFRRSSAPGVSGQYVGLLDTKPQEQGSKLLWKEPLVTFAASVDPASGYMLFPREGALWAQAFNPSRIELTGERVVLAERIVDTRTSRALTAVSASANGVLVYRTGDDQDLQLTWYDRQGKVLGTLGEPGRYGDLALSPDGTRLAVSLADAERGNRAIWLLDLERGTPTLFTFDSATDVSPVWSPDGSRIAFASNRGGANGAIQDVYQKASSGGRSEELLLHSSQGLRLSHWSPDGRFLIYQSANASEMSQHPWVLPLSGDRRPFSFARTELDERWGRFSPNSRWVAYVSNESGTGRSEIYVRPFDAGPGAGPAIAEGKWMVSRGALGIPRWRADGKELFYLAPDGKIMAVEVSTDSLFRAGAPAPLFQVPPIFLQTPAAASLMDITPDGKRFLFALPVPHSAQGNLTVMLNWQAGYKK